MASADGWFYMFDVNTQEGGICKLLTQASIYSPNPTLFTNNTIGNNNNNNIVNNNSHFNINNLNNNNNNNDEITNHHHLNQQQSYENQNE